MSEEKDTWRIEVGREIWAERNRQTEKHGDQSDRSPSDMHVILSEEVGEVAAEICGYMVTGVMEPNYRTELIQVAATAIQMIEYYDRRNGYAN